MLLSERKSSTATTCAAPAQERLPVEFFSPSQAPAVVIQAPLLPNISASSSPDAKTVLVIASRFPPVASVGAVRVRKFVKYLSQNGWRPVVLTGAMRNSPTHSEDARRAVDLDSLADIPPTVPVHRLGPVMDHWPTHLTALLSSTLAEATSRFGWDSHRWSHLMKWRFENIHDALAFPDRGVWRLPIAVNAALQLHRKYRFDAVFSSGMPFSDHLVGLALHTIIRRPWLVDFRDPWVEYIHWQQWQSAVGQRLTQVAEAAVIRRAARVISVNENMTGRFMDRYSAQNREKFVTIENGFDPDDFPNVSSERSGAQFKLIYAGSLYKTRSPVTVLEGFRKFVEQTPGAKERACFQFAGRPGSFVEELSRPEDEGRVSYIGLLTHGRALAEMSNADVNVIILPNLPGGGGDSTTKLYECLGSGRAILAAVPGDGAAATTLKRFDGVWICNPDDVQQIATVLGDLYRRWLCGDLQPRRSPRQLEPLTRSRQAMQLVECLNAVTAATHS